MYSRHVQSTQKEQLNNHNVVAELVVVERQNLVGHKLALIKDHVAYNSP